MLLWNDVIPIIFVGGRSIDYLHAVGLLVLRRIPFGGSRGGGGRRWGRRRLWRQWDRMTPEKREQLRQSYSVHREKGEPQT